MSEQHVALVSGGRDSTVAAEVAVTDGPCDILVYPDTGTGLETNHEYVKDLADHLGVQLWTLQTHEDYSERVREHCFPGASRHSIMYRTLKERQLQRLASRLQGDVHCWTGVRSAESERRMRQVEPEQEGLKTAGRGTRRFMAGRTTRPTSTSTSPTCRRTTSGIPSADRVTASVAALRPARSYSISRRLKLAIWISEGSTSSREGTNDRFTALYAC